MEKYQTINIFLSCFLFLLYTNASTEVHVEKELPKHHDDHDHVRHHYAKHKLFVFGDSYADTGNSRKDTAVSWKPPYGITFPGKPAGRFSNGRVLTDYLASFLGIKSPVPYRQIKSVNKSKLKYGMNFAFGGTGVFNTMEKEPNMSNQISFFEEILEKNLYSKRDLNWSVALVSVAGNDYGAYLAKGGNNNNMEVVYLVDSLDIRKIGDEWRNFDSEFGWGVEIGQWQDWGGEEDGTVGFKGGAGAGVRRGFAIEGLQNFTTSIIDQLVENMRRILSLGVRKIAVTALEPLGCLPPFTASSSYKDCNQTFNSVSDFHNKILRRKLQTLKTQSAEVLHIVVLDLHSTFISAFKSIRKNISTGNISTLVSPMKPCCVGISKEYSCGSFDENGAKKYILCKNPELSFFWDMIHPSQNGWNAVFSALRSSLRKLFK
ncbi:Lipase [Parasponia andersonii]|uniref:Lipase n=1 Tax=Parasponia andersonii TaxID=3476 RepID=A0A2P5DCY6_PARAD|nr:Lipase [Parasponia andersonii]